MRGYSDGHVKNMLIRLLIYPKGRITPLAVWWADGILFEIDKVLDVRPAASLKAGVAGIRYSYRIKGYEKYIWLEENRWFVETKEIQNG